MENIHGDQGDGETRLFDDDIQFLSKILRRGDGLDGMIRTIFRTISASLARFNAELGNGRTVDVWE